MNELRLDVIGDDEPFISIYEAKIQKYIGSTGLYYFQYEHGKETDKPHIQGFCLHSKKSETFRDYMNKFLREKYPSKSSAKAHAVLRNVETQQAYILNNELKTTQTRYWTNYEPDALQTLRDTLPVFMDKEKFVFQKEEERKQRKENWSDLVFNRMCEKCIHKNLHNCSIIQYDLLEDQMYGLPKSLDYSIYKRNLMGLTKRLEEKYHHHSNKRIKHLFNREVRNDPQLDSVFNMKQ